jgi:FkbM family methyltransferase
VKKTLLNLIRKIIRFYFQQKPSRILNGIGKGLKWYPNSSLLAFWLGRFERLKQEAMALAFKPNQCVYDLGANVGFYSLIAARSVGNSGLVIAFEPDPRNLVWLEKHKNLNGFTNLQILPYAVGNIEGHGGFVMDLHPCLSHLSDTTDCEKVQIRKIDNMIAEEIIPPADIMKIDIEGGAYNGVLGAEKMIRSRHPLIFLAIDTSQDLVCMDLLKSWGYKFEPISSGEFRGEYQSS